jgi:hypothetical protein
MRRPEEIRFWVVPSSLLTLRSAWSAFIADEFVIREVMVVTFRSAVHPGFSG